MKDLIEITLRRMDHDRDGRVSFDDFRMTVLQVNKRLFECYLLHADLGAPFDGGFWRVPTL